MIRKRQHLMLEFVQRVRCASRTGSSESLLELLGWMEVCLWRIASFRCDAEFGRYRGIADIDQAAPINLDL